MFQRNITDTTGLEPFQLFNVVQFMMYDKDNSGKVTVDETMHMLYARYGKARLEMKMKDLFGEDLKTADGDGELSFEEYLKAVSIRIPKNKKKKSQHSSQIFNCFSDQSRNITTTKNDRGGSSRRGPQPGDRARS